MKRFIGWIALALSWATLVRVGLSRSAHKSGAGWWAAFVVLTTIWAAIDGARQVATESALRSQIHAARARASDAYCDCTCGAWRKDADNRGVVS